ncbi:hypothetical protein [Oceanicoccus sp. KOV_DT_Chl]|uniref:hypothetical protein n=1 Tax=Oceanicoccus sp. KOV_DT_Chl TaxID=1904639 RepID=UPI000C7AF8F8|nr:hypothetical protein [Oceanicoccus sp. KOV_DT_Chl]
MATSIESSWIKIKSLTDEMISNSSREDWLGVSETAKQRHKLITLHFSNHPVGPDTAEFYQQHLNELMQNEAGLQSLITAARKKSMKENSFINNRKRIQTAYRQST